MKSITLLLLFFAIFHSNAASSAINDVAKSAIEKKLAYQSRWLKIGHYDLVEEKHIQFKSDVISSNFFLSARGQFDPEAELKATIDQIFAPIPDNPNLHAQCRFPARYLWLKKQLNFNDEPKVECGEFDRFTIGKTVSSISIVLATGFLGNPASYYGHTLIKFNSSLEGKSQLLDETLNYGAILPRDPNPIIYIVKGVFGGYEGGFSNIQFYFHDYHYGDNELRDIWEYELQLTPDEVSMITAHAWELVGKKFRYYFFKKNCGYQTANLINAVTDIDLDPKNPLYSIPQAMILRAAAINDKGKKLINKISYYPSRQSRLYKKYGKLKKPHKQLVRSLVSNVEKYQDTQYQVLSDSEKAAINEVLIDYHHFVAKKNQRSPNQDGYKKALSELFDLPSSGSNFDATTELIRSPHISRKPSLIQFNGIANESNAGFSVRVRPAYYDPLDADNGHVKHAALSMMDAEIEYFHGNLQVKALDLISIVQTNHAATFLPDDRGDSWRLKAGLKKQDIDCESCLVARIEGSKGYSSHVSENMLASVYLGGALQDQKNNNGHGFLNNIYNISYQREKISFQLEYEKRYHLNGYKNIENLARLESRYAITKNLDARVRIEHYNDTQIAFGLGIYF